MNLPEMTTDDLLAALPPDEDNRWELKSANLLTNKGELKRELGKQMSAFSNSGGGYLAIGFADKTRIPQSCGETVGRQPMKDYLATLSEQSVEYPLQTYSVHRIPFTSDPAQAVFVIAVEDSPAAPHQAKDERQYYWRLDGKSVPAPHFHLELLRNRATRAVLMIDELSATEDMPLTILELKNKTITLQITLRVKVTNISGQIANPHALRITSDFLSFGWQLNRDDKLNLMEGALMETATAVLFPSASDYHDLVLRASIPFSENPDLAELAKSWDQLELQLQPLSHDYVGEVFRWRASDPDGERDGNSIVSQLWEQRKREHERIEGAMKETGRLLLADFQHNQRILRNM